MQPKRYSIKRLFKFTESDKEQILNQKYINLRTAFEKAIGGAHPSDPYREKVIDGIKALFQKECSWDNINTIELYLTDLLTEHQITMSVELKLIECKERFSPEAYAFYCNQLSVTKKEEKRNLLSQLIEDLQFSFDFEDLIRDYTRLLRIRTNLLFVLSLLVFFMVDQFTFLSDALGIMKGGRSDAIVTAMTSGWIGASLSILTGLRKKINSSTVADLRVIHRMEYLFSRILIGMISGLVLYYFFQAGILAGEMFPAFNQPQSVTEIADNRVIMNYENHAKLIIWCFASGFSEKLVPDILSGTARKVKI